MKKTFQVKMLPTEKASKLYKEDNGVLNSTSKEETPDEIHQSQHLYIISDDKIKEGDWFTNEQYFISDKIKYAIWQSNSKITPNSNPKKVIATTDSLITHQCNSCKTEKNPFECGCQLLPQLPESFIKAYIKAYNENNPITEVDLEVEPSKGCCGDTKGSCFERNHCTREIKTRPDNTVIVHTSKTYTKDEMFKEVINFAKFYSNMEQDKIIRAYNRWIVERDESITLK